MKIRVALMVAFWSLAVGLSFYNFRAFLPTPGGYITRLQVLEGWSDRGYYAFNCSGFISNAHGENFLSERQMFAGNDKMKLVARFSSLTTLDESKIKPGDVAAFAGPEGVGLHVAAYLGRGRWVDGDSRRGFVAEYQLSEKSTSDDWFKGEVRIVRWSTPEASSRVNFAFFDDEQASIGR